MEIINIQELINVIWRRRLLIILIMATFLLLGGLYSFFIVEPEYLAETTILIARPVTTTGTNSVEIIQEIQMSQKLVYTYSEIAKSNTVLTKVIDETQIPIKEEALSGSIEVAAVKNTEILKISIVNKTPAHARQLSEALTKAFTERIKEFYQMQNVNVIDPAKEPTAPYNINHVSDILLFAAIGFFVCATLVFLFYYFDTTVKTADDIEKKLGLNLLTIIPFYDKM